MPTHNNRKLWSYVHKLSGNWIGDPCDWMIKEHPYYKDGEGRQWIEKVYHSTTVHYYTFQEETLWSIVPLEKLLVAQLVQFLAFGGMWRFIVTSACQWSLSWARWIQSLASCVLVSTLKLPFRLHQGLCSGFMLSEIFVWTLHLFFFPYGPHPSHPPWFAYFNNTAFGKQ